MESEKIQVATFEKIIVLLIDDEKSLIEKFCNELIHLDIDKEFEFIIITKLYLETIEKLRKEYTCPFLYIQDLSFENVPDRDMFWLTLNNKIKEIDVSAKPIALSGKIGSSFKSNRIENAFTKERCFEKNFDNVNAIFTLLKKDRSQLLYESKITPPNDNF
jgi:hypothetical protein